MPHYGLRKVVGPIKRKCENGMNSRSDSFKSGVTLKTMLGMPDNNYTIEPSHNPLQGMTSVCLMKAQSELLGTSFPVTTQGKGSRGTEVLSNNGNTVGTLF